MEHGPIEVTFYDVDTTDELFNFWMYSAPRAGETVHLWHDTLDGMEKPPSKDFEVVRVMHDLRLLHAPRREPAQVHIVVAYVRHLATTPRS